VIERLHDWRIWQGALGSAVAIDDIEECLKDLRVGDARAATVLLPIRGGVHRCNAAERATFVHSWRRRSSRHTVFCRLWTHPTHALARDRPNPNP
jgi:hypothetical protein